MKASIFITGATGAIGTQLIKKLAATGTPFKALVRTREAGDLIASIPNAEIVIGDLADQEGLVNVLHGIERAFLLTNSSDEAEYLQMNFVEAAHRANVKHIVKLSQLGADKDSPVRFLRYHAKVEERIRSLHFTYTFLRPNLFMQGLLAFKDLIRDEGRFYAAIGNAAISIVDIRDIAAVAVAALTEAGHDNKIYTITGPEALTHYQLAETISSVLNKPVTFIDVTPEQMRGALAGAGFPIWQLEGVMEDYAHYSRGEAASVDSAVTTITNTVPGSFEKFVCDYKFAFGEQQ